MSPPPKWHCGIGAEDSAAAQPARDIFHAAPTIFLYRNLRAGSSSWFIGAARSRLNSKAPDPSRSAKLNGVDPEAYLRHAPIRIADHPVNRGAVCCPGT
jgi:hypothetical protein